jgi:hypothetical protein
LNGYYLLLIILCIFNFVDRNLNIALGKPVTMSSFWKLHSGPASVAVDGKRSGILLHTNYEYGSWVKIDLQQEVLLAILT